MGAGASCCLEEAESASLLQEKPASSNGNAMVYSAGRQEPLETPKKKLKEADMDPETTLQCKRCRKIYKVKDNGPEMCTYHKGRFVKGSTAPMSSTKWTCCKSVIRDKKGCKTGPHRAAADGMFAVPS